MSFLIKEIYKLSEDAQKLACFLAYASKIVDTPTLKKFLHAYNHEDSYIRTLLTELSTMDMFVEANICRGKLRVQIMPFWYISILKFLIKEQPQWIVEFTKLKVDRSGTLLSIYEDITHLLTEKDYEPKTTIRHTEYFSVEYFLYSVILEEDLHKLVKIIPNDYLCAFFTNAIEALFQADVLDEDRAIAHLLPTLKGVSNAHLQHIKDITALYYYYSFGEYSPQGNGTTLYDCILRAVHSMHVKDYPSALDYFNKALKEHNNNSKTKNVLEHSFSCYALIAYYLNTSGNEDKIRVFMNKSSDYYGIDSLVLASMAVALRMPSVYIIDTSSLRSMHMNGSKYEYKIFKLFANFISQVSDIPAPKDYISNYYPNSAILQHEFQYFLEMSDDRRAELNNLFGTPLLYNEKPKPQWAMLLDEIVSECDDKEEQQEQQDKQFRICYMINGNFIDVREQKKKLNGEWSGGKNVSDKDYSTPTKVASMNATDIKISNMNGGCKYNLTVDRVIPYLIGSDRVYTGMRSPYDQVTIDEEKPYVLIDMGKKEFKISSNIPKIDNRNEYVIKRSKKHYTVIRINHSDKNIFTKLLELKTLPFEAEGMLRDYIPKIKRRINIISSILDKSEIVKTKASDKVILQISTVDNKNYKIQIFVRPIPGSEKIFQPGVGLVTVIDKDTEGNMVQAKRCLSTEKKNKAEICDYMKYLTNKMRSLFFTDDSLQNTSWTIDMFELLELLIYARDHKDICDVEWLNGVKLKVNNITEVKDWNISLKFKGGWFDVEGKIEIDNDVYITVADIIDKMDDMHSNYIRLTDNDFILITNKIKKQLEEIKAMSISKGDTLRVPTTNAILLDDTLEDCTNVRNIEELKAIVEKIRNSYTMKPKVPTTLNATLRDYQEEGYVWMSRLASWGGGCCLADDMGLGKTVQAIAMLLANAEKGVSIVVAPTSVVYNWKSELERFAPSLNVSVINELSSDDRETLINDTGKNDVLLVSYGVLCSEAKYFTSRKWNVICLDEAHSIKNKETKTARTVYKLNGDIRIALTGTPIQNHLGELWSLFNFINPGMLDTFDEFKKKFIVPIENGNSNQKELLRRIILPFVLRRTKKEVVHELPDKTDIQVRIDLSKKELSAYECIRKRALKRLKEDKKLNMNILADLTKLRLAACSLYLADNKLDFESTKLTNAFELLKNLTEEDNRVLVFSQFTSFLHLLREKLDKEGISYLYLDGTTPIKTRKTMVDKFQKGGVNLFVISLKAGGLGLNLTNANYVLHLDPWWNPAIEDQATDRAYRIGQKDNVTVYHLIASNTIEEKILRLHESKRYLADSLLDGADTGHQLTEEDVRELLS